MASNLSSQNFTLKECGLELCHVGTHLKYCRYHSCMKDGCSMRNTQGFEYRLPYNETEMEKTDTKNYCNEHK